MKRPIWFKAKRYGWGWYPATWQGWLIMLLFIILIFLDFQRIDSASHSVSDTLINWIPDIFIFALILILICFSTAELPKWRWGGKE